MQVIVDNLLVNYSLSGSGKTLLLIHGWGDDSSTFNQLTEILSRNHQVVSLDLPGFGKSQQPTAAWDLDDYSKFIKKFLLKLKISNPFAIIGHSNGGALAIRAISLGELKPSKLVLLASSGVRAGKSIRKALTKTVAKTGKIATFWTSKNTKQKLRKKLYGVMGSDMLVAPHMQETFKRTVSQDVQSDAGKLKLSTLLIYGDKDKAVPVTDGERLASLIRGSRLEILPGVDHFVHLTASSEVVNLIESFIDGNN